MIAECHDSHLAMPVWEVTEGLRQLHVVGASAPVIGREKVEELEERILALQQAGKMEKATLLCTHYFCEGMYARELYVPAGTILTGKVHKTEHMIMLVKGDMTIWTHDGMRRVKAPFVLTSKAGAKRAGLAHEDCIWIGFFPNPQNETDPFRMEDSLVEQPLTIKGGDTSCLV